MARVIFPFDQVGHSSANKTFLRISSRLQRAWLHLLLPLLLPVLGMAPAYAQTTAPTQPTRNLIIEINGAEALTRLLNAQLDLRRYADEADPLNADEVQRLVAGAPRQIRELLATEGYFSPAIEPVLDLNRSPWLARFDIRLGEPTRVDAVDLRFRGEIAEGASADLRRIERLRRQWSLDPGLIFRQESWNEAKSNLLKGLLNRDFPAAKIVHSEARIDPAQRVAVLTVEVDSGPVFTFGPLEVQGLQRYPRTVVDGLNPIKPGERFSQEKLNELQARLQESGYFRSAFAAIEVDSAHPHNVPVRVDLNENERKRLSLGGGFSTDTGARLQAKWLDRNFLQRDWRLESEFRIDRDTRLLGADLLFPAIKNGWRPGANAHYERTDIEGEVSDKIRTGARITSPEKADEKVWSVAYLADRQRIAGGPAAVRRALIGSLGYTRRRVDNLISPRRGYVASVEIGGGLAGVVTDQNLLRLVARGTWLEPFDRSWLAVLKGQAGQVLGASRQTVPGDLLFRTGGDQSVRGYSYNSLGVAEGNAVVGGRVFAVLSAELVYRVTPQWGAAVFTDAGNASDAWADFRLKRSTGVGARWRSPIGPVNIDVAYGHATRAARLHFSVGYGF